MNGRIVVVAADEVEPCLRSASGAPTSTTGGSSEQNDDKPDRCIGCILATLLLLLFIVSVALAFLFGHWAAEYERYRKEQIVESGVEVDVDEDFTADVYPPSSFDNLVDSLVISGGNRTRKPIYLLPSTVIPVHYDLALDFTDFSTDEQIRGNVSTLFECVDDVLSLVIHAADTVNLLAATLTRDAPPSGDSDDLAIETITRDADNQIVTIKPAGLLSAGWYVLTLRFETKICVDDHIEGVHCYRPQQYKERTNSSGTVVSFTTKFEPALAKTFFPCWDQPSYKTTYNVTITHQKHITILTNTAAYTRRLNRRTNHITTYYLETPPMPSYLLAFAVGPMISLDATTSRGLPLSIWTMPEDLLNARFASNFSTGMFDLQEEEFAIIYPLSKMDFVAARSFPVGGMENWGIVVFHHNMLLFESSDIDEQTDLTVDVLMEQYKISKIVTHEIAHQWFGNLVSIGNWSELWLNEGFATYYVYEFLSRTRRELTDNEYYIRLVQLMAKQSSDEKLSLVRNFTTEYQVYRSFDRLHLYTKGCVAVRMIHSLIDDFDFRSGIRRYLKRSAYGTVTRMHLWASLPTYAHFGHTAELLADVMEPWLVNPGFPEIHIWRDYQDGLIRINQLQSDQKRHRVYLSAKEEEANLTWTIPFSYAFGSNDSIILREFWFKNTSMAFTDLDLKSSQYILANPGWKFAYKINYDVDNWRMLITQLHSDPSEIPVKSRIQLITDSELFLKNSEHLDLYVSLLRYLANEFDLGPLLIGLDALFRLVETYQATRAHNLLLIYFKPVIDQLDRVYALSQSTLEKAAVWLIEPNRLSQLYLLRCVANQPTCHQPENPNQWLLSPMPRDQDHNQQLAALCHALYSQGQRREFDLMDALLRQNAGKWSTVLHLASCVRDEVVLETAVRQVVETKNLAMIASLLQGGYSLHHNANFRAKIWRQLVRLSADERRRLFAGKPLFARLLIYSIKSTKELDWAARAVPGLADDKRYLRYKFDWIENNAVPSLEQWLINRLRLKR